jgi:hypothetical protein
MAKEEISPFGLTPSDIAARAKRQMEDLANLQSELLDKLQETNRQWLDRIEAESRIVSAACQMLGNRRFELLGEDAKHLIDDTQKFIQTGANFFASSGQSKEPVAGGK